MGDQHFRTERILGMMMTVSSVVHYDESAMDLQSSKFLN